MKVEWVADVCALDVGRARPSLISGVYLPFRLDVARELETVEGASETLIAWARARLLSPRPGCPIKGNISVGSGEHIYHTPWSPVYEKTVIDVTKGERWFCDEGEAVAAGWRAARFR